ncbi:efflux RND transporter periplasmic adaptor subunit [Acidihalobacter prosperus]
MKRLIRYAVIAAIAVALVVGGAWYWYESKYYPSTSDAYVGAHTVRVAPQVAGRVVKVAVHDHQQVSKDQLLYRIDPTTYRLKVEQAKAQLALAQQQVAQLQASVTAAKAQVEQAKVQLANAASKAKRQQRLVSRGYTDAQTAQDAQAAEAAARAALGVSEARLAEARAQLGRTGDANHQVQLAKAALDMAETNLRDTQVTASCDGRLSGLKLRPGDYVDQGQPNFVLVCDKRWWVDANFKETDLARIHPGEAASVTVDTYGGHSFRGRVVSINPASGTAFSLLPPENATGNWVKVTQRVPVRIEILDPSPKYPLRVGTSAEVSIDTLHKSPAAEAQQNTP